MIKQLKLAAAAMATFGAGFGLATIGTSHGQTAPAGWTVQQGTVLGWIATSPYQGQLGRVRLIFYPVEATSENFERWFAARGEARARAFGQIVRVHTFSPPHYEQGQAPLAALMRTIKGNDGKDYFVESYGYDTPQGLQLVQIVSPATIPETNAAYRAALQALSGNWRSRTSYAQGSAPRPPAPTASSSSSSTGGAGIPPPPPGGRNCRREPVWGWAVRYGCSASAICNERVIKDYEWVCDR